MQTPKPFFSMFFDTIYTTLKNTDFKNNIDKNALYYQLLTIEHFFDLLIESTLSYSELFSTYGRNEKLHLIACLKPTLYYFNIIDHLDKLNTFFTQKNTKNYIPKRRAITLYRNIAIAHWPEYMNINEPSGSTIFQARNDRKPALIPFHMPIIENIDLHKNILSETFEHLNIPFYFHDLSNSLTGRESKYNNCIYNEDFLTHIFSLNLNERKKIQQSIIHCGLPAPIIHFPKYFKDKKFIQTVEKFIEISKATTPLRTWH